MTYYVWWDVKPCSIQLPRNKGCITFNEAPDSAMANLSTSTYDLLSTRAALSMHCTCALSPVRCDTYELRFRCYGIVPTT